MRIIAMLCTLVLLIQAQATALAADEEFSASKAWKKVIEKSDAAGIQASYLLAHKLEGEDGNFDPELCRSEASGLEKALQDNPASLAVQAAASGCAAALQDNLLAERHAQNFAALVREAIGQHAENFGEIPVRVMSEPDIAAFIKASGEESINLYYAPGKSGVSMMMHVALADTEHDRERWLSFDFLDAQVAMQRKLDFAEFPIFRFQLGKNLLHSGSATEGTVAGEAKALYDALATLKGDQLDASLVAMAQQGNYAALSQYVYACLQRRAAECESTSIDLLLPWAEARGARAMLLLAVLQADPMHGKADEKSAKTLLDAADRRLGAANASAQFAAIVTSRHPGQKLGTFVRKRLQIAVDQRNPNAEWLLASQEITVEKRYGKLREKTLVALIDAAEAGFPGAQDTLARHLWAVERKEDARKWFASAAELGDVDAQRWLASAFESGVNMPADPEKARHWHTKAANNGDVDSMLRLADYYEDQPATKETRYQISGWLRSASIFGSADAKVRLADLLKAGGDGVGGGPKDAEMIYRAAINRYGRADARRGLASLLFGTEGIEKNVEEARKLLDADAEKGDSDSQLELALHLLRGDFGPDKAGAREWLVKAADSGNAKARNELGVLLYYDSDGLGRDAKAGIARIESAAGMDHRQARNNLAWMLCTTDVIALRDAQRGLGVAKLLNEEVANDVPAWIDTLAACHAATDDFDQAARLEQQMVDILNERQPDNRDIPYFSARVKQYRERKPYVETVKAK